MVIGTHLAMELPASQDAVRFLTNMTVKTLRIPARSSNRARYLVDDQILNVLYTRGNCRMIEFARRSFVTIAVQEVIVAEFLNSDACVVC